MAREVAYDVMRLRKEGNEGMLVLVFGVGAGVSTCIASSDFGADVVSRWCLTTACKHSTISDSVRSNTVVKASSIEV